MISCACGQRQGYITITRSDGITHELTPVSGKPGNFRDQDGRWVYRHSGLGSAGLIFRFPGESVDVYWSIAAVHSCNGNTPTAPFSIKDDDPTTLRRCKAAGRRSTANARRASCERRTGRRRSSSRGGVIDHRGNTGATSDCERGGDGLAIRARDVHSRELPPDRDRFVPG